MYNPIALQGQTLLREEETIIVHRSRNIKGMGVWEMRIERVNLADEKDVPVVFTDCFPI